MCITPNFRCQSCVEADAFLEYPHHIRWWPILSDVFDDNFVCSLLTVRALQEDDGSAKVLGGDVWGWGKPSEVVL